MIKEVVSYFEIGYNNLIRNHIKCFLIIFLLFSLNSIAQETITPLSYNPIIKARYTGRPDLFLRLKRVPDSALKPFPLDKFAFFDDFSAESLTTNKAYWLDNDVFINNDMAINPPSIGVATFDGLNQLGEPYKRGQVSSNGLIADHLTSVPIDLSKMHYNDSIYLSFFYQPAGLGDAPYPIDSFCLEFKPQRIWTGTTWDSTAWVRIWSTKGTLIKPFKQIIIPVKPYLRNPSQTPDTIANFYYDSFQFRFLNYGNLSGNLHLWHLDYVYLAKGRNCHDTTYNEIALVNPPVSLISDYMSIPWQHLIFNFGQKDTIMVEYTPLYARYLGNNFLNLRSGFEIHNGITNALLLQNLNVDNRDLYPNQIIKRSVGPIRNKFPFDSFKKIGYNERVVLKTTLLQVNHDIRSSNDSSSRVQEFSNYYAYDDGTAEAAYGLKLSSFSINRVAYKFRILKKDTLRGMQIFFTFLLDDVSNKPFKIMVWKGDYTKAPAYTMDTYVPVFSDSLVNNFYTYKFDTFGFVIDTGDIYIGWEQTPNYCINIGFDMNYYRLRGDTVPNVPNPNLFYYDKNTWFTSEYSGALMIRPIIGHEILNSINQPKKFGQTEISFYPNPARDKIVFTNLNCNKCNLNLVDLNGKVVITKDISNNNHDIEINFVKNGIYFIRIYNEKGVNILNSKLIVCH